MTGEADKKDDHFLSRWARRKAAVRAEEQPPAPATETVPSEEDVVDLNSLPPIETLTADSDYSVFLKKGVPAALRMAALRKLWVTEPSVVNYKPLVEYNWDFTAPGYGQLLPTDDVAKFARTVLEGTARTEPAAKSEEIEAPEPEPPAAPSLLGEDDAVATAEASPAADVVDPAPVAMPRRRHGGALPS